jgi:hypothetical protein
MVAPFNVRAEQRPFPVFVSEAFQRSSTSHHAQFWRAATCTRLPLPRELTPLLTLALAMAMALALALALVLVLVLLLALALSWFVLSAWLALTSFSSLLCSPRTISRSCFGIATLPSLAGRPPHRPYLASTSHCSHLEFAPPHAGTQKTSRAQGLSLAARTGAHKTIS